MNRFREQLHFGVIICLSVLIVVDAVLFSYVKIANRSIRQNTSAFYNKNAPFVTEPPTGFSANGTLLNMSAKPIKGWAVRYSARDCRYCQKDQAEWKLFSASLKKLGLAVLVLSSDEHQESKVVSEDPDSLHQISFVDMGWLQSIHLNSTPTSLIFDQNGELIWAHRGTLSPGDPAAAVSEIKAHESIRN